MVFGKEKLYVIIQEKDFIDEGHAIIGYNIDIIYIPKELFLQWETSIVKMAILPTLNKGGKIIKI